jgi:energy-coupling factor transporter transmembrane protein EcfT
MIKQMFVMISDSGNLFISKFITYFGLTGIGVGTVQAAASSEIAQATMPTLASVCTSTPSWVAIASGIGAICFAIQRIAETVFKYIEHKERMK